MSWRFDLLLKRILQKLQPAAQFALRAMLFACVFQAQAFTVTYTTPGTGNWGPVPAGVTSAVVEVWGGGGAGGGNTQAANGGGGGGGGGYSKSTITVTAGNSYAYQVGSGGTPSAGNAGGVGVASYFINSATLMANPGAGGAAATAGSGGTGGSGGATGAGTTLFSGGSGGNGRTNATGRGAAGGSSAGTAANGLTAANANNAASLIAQAGPAGSGIGGDGGDAGFDGSAPAALNYGGGGGGSGDTGSRTGGAGAGGKIVITYKVNQTITFGAQTTPRAYVASGTFAISPVATTTAAALTITYSSLTASVCTVAGTTVTIVTTGTCTIAANQAGDADTNAAPQVTQSVTISPASQTITFAAQTTATRTYASGGTFAINPVATASSGLAITYNTLSTPLVCSVAGTTVTILTAGTCTITATQAGNTNYNAATSVSQNVTINKANQTITFNAQATPTRTYAAGLTFAINPVATTSGVGLTITYNTTSTASVCSVAGTTITVLTAGTCTITATQGGNTNYNAATSVSQNVTINKANQTITFNAQTTTTRTYVASGTFAISPVATTTSGLPITYTTSAACSVSGTTITMLAVGTCTITATQPGNTNYNAATSVARSVTITKAAQTITVTTPAPASAAYLSQFTVAATASSGLTVAYTSGSPAICTVSGAIFTMLVPTGTCIVWYDQAGNTNYNAATRVTSNTTATKASQTITVNTPAPASAAYLSTFTVAATASSGLAVAYTSGNLAICTVSVATFTMQAPSGTCPVRYDQAGNANYFAATQVTSNTTATKINQTIGTISFSPTTLAVGGTTTASATGGASGNPVTFSIPTTPLICSATGTNGATITGLAAGTCTVAADQAGNTNYNFATQVTQNITVTISSQTITFGVQAAQTYSPGGSFSPSPLATASSGLTVSYASSTPGVCTVALPTVATIAIVSAGTCTITASQAGNGSYSAATPVTQNITINPANQTISFGAQAAQLYSAGGTFAISPTATATSGLPVTYSSLTALVCSVSGTTVTIITAGTCTIAANVAATTNYNAAPQVTQNVIISAATHLAFFQQPNNTAASSSISPAISVEILDAANQRVTASTATVTLAILNNAGPGGVLSGTLVVAASSGLATFSGLSINLTGTGYTLSATSPGLTSATSSSFNITAASLCFSDDFNRASLLPSANWTRTKGAGTFFNADIVANRLRLTDATPFNATTNPGETTAVHLQRLFPGAGNKVTAEFDYYAYNGNGADGMVMTLSDASVAPVAGAFGGSLGYAQKCQNGVSGCASDCAVVGGCPGFTGGWIGVGLDEYGNYSNPSEGRIGGPGVLADSVAIRGSGSGQSGYNYHTRAAASGGVDSTVVQTGTNAAPGHRYRIIVDHSDGVHAMTSVDRDTTGVRDVNGDSLPANYTAIIPAYDAKAIGTQAAVPANWFFSFTASTGGSYNIHEIDNLKVCTAQPMVTPVLDHVRIIHDGAALTCAAETITLKACEDAACTAVYTGTVTVNLNAIAGATWSLSNPVTITGGQIQLTLTKATTGTVTLGGATAAPTPTVSVTCYKGSTSGDCSLTYSSAACAFDAVETRTPVKTPPGHLYTKVAGTAFTADILALNAGAVDAAYRGTVTVDLVDMNGVASGSCGTTQLATTTPASPYTQTHTYTAGNAGRWTTANFSYPNAVKEVSIRMVSGATTVCSDRFTIRPYSFGISSPTLATNPLATSASIFKSGAALFTLSATAGNASAVTTTNYSTNALIRANRLEAHASAIQTGTLSGSFSANNLGVSTGTAFTYSEVGNFRFKAWGVTDDGSIFAAVDYDADECFRDDGSISPSDPNVADPTKDYQYGCYFGNTAASSYFGRFVPNHFETVVTGPMTCGALTFTPATACPAGGLVYSGQPFTTAVTAYTYGGTAGSGITKNYDTTAAYSKTVTLSAWDALGGSTANPPSGGGAISANTVQPTSFASGVATATLTPFYTFTTKPTAPTNIYIRAIDTDSVTSLNPTASSSVEGGVKVVSGRLRLANALGSEKLPLVVSAEAQFYNGANWLTNTQDTSSTGAWSVSPAGSNLLVGTGATGSTSGTLGTPLVAGVTTLTASAPGAGGFGYRDLTVVVPDYLKFAWTGVGAISPTSRVSFGIYKGNNRIIYRRERY